MDVMSSISVMLGVLIALIAYLTNLNWKKKDNQEAHSEFYLKRAIDGLDILHDLLKDRNNDRITWIKAARVLLDNAKVSEKITSNVHKVIYELKKDYIRHLLFMVLHPKNNITGVFEPLPPRFFYGIEDWVDDILLDDAARASTDPVKARSVEIYKLLHTPKLSSLNEKSIVAIYEFLKYPDDYEDRLGDVKTWDLTKNECFDYLFESPWKYLKHKNEHVVHGGMCYPEDDKEAGRKEWLRVYKEPPPDISVK